MTSRPVSDIWRVPCLIECESGGFPGRVFNFTEQETQMASKTQKTEKIRHRKSAPNKANRKAENNRLHTTIDTVAKLEKENRK